MMKYTNWLRHQLCISVFLPVFFSAGLFSANLGAQVVMIPSQENQRIVENQLDIMLAPKSIDINATLVSRHESDQAARSEHLQIMQELRNQMLAISVSLTQDAEKDIDLDRQSNLLRLRSAETLATSHFSISLTADTQLTQVLAMINNASNIDIQSYKVVYDETTGSDQALITQLTDSMLTDIRNEASESGENLTPRGFSRLDVETEEIGRDFLDALFEGQRVQEWTQSDQDITLIKTSKKVSVGLILS